MNKNFRFIVISIGVILSLLASGLNLRSAAWAQEGSYIEQQTYLPLLISGSTSQSFGIGNTGTGSINGQTITRILARGGPNHGANGLYFGPDGYLYIASCFGANITVMDPNSGHIVRKIMLPEGMNGPDDLTFGPDGSLYWTAITTGVIGKMAPDGTFSVVAQLPIGVNPITFTDDGQRLFTALDFLGDGLYELYLDGSPPRLILPTLGWLNGFDFGPDGLLYGPLIHSAKVVKIDVDTGEMWDVVTGVWGTAAVKFGPDGMMYFINQPTGEVKRVDLDSGEIELITILPNSLDNLAFDAKGRLFVSSAEDGFIVEVMMNGEVRPVSPGGMIAPGGVAVLPDGKGHDNLFVGDLWVLRQFNGQTGKELFVERLFELAEAHTVAPDGENLIVTSFMSNAVYFYDPSSRSLIDTRFDFSMPINAIRFQGDLIVGELGTGAVVRSSGPGDRQELATLAVPLGLAATQDDLWVADWYLGMIFQLVQDGAPVMIPLASGLVGPEGLAVLPDGNLLVVEAGASRVSLIDAGTGSVTPFVEDLELGGMHLSGLPPFLIFNGIAVSQQTGAIYVTGDTNNLLYRIDQRP